eukprot:gene13849-15296_t
MSNNSNSTIAAAQIILRPEIFEEPTKTVLQTLFVLVSIVGTISNCFVLLLIFKTKQLHTPLNFLLANLSLADLIGGLSIYSYVFLDVSRTSIRGYKADILCVLSTGLIIFFTCSVESILTLCAISISRFLTIKFPMKQNLKLTKTRSTYFIVASWIASILLLIPTGLCFKYEAKTGYCYRYKRPGINMRLYSLATTVFGTVLPLTTMSLTYIAAWRQLWSESSKQVQDARRGTSGTRKKVMVLLGLLIVTYVLCWSPFYIYWIMIPLLKYYPNTAEGRIKIFRFHTIVMLFGLCNSTIDPILYTLQGQQFRHEINRRLRKRRGTVSNEGQGEGK